MRRWLTVLWQRARALWLMAKNEHASPRQIGWAVGVGVFTGCTPAIGFHGGLALALATVLRLNRLWTWIGSRICNVLLLPWIVLAEIQIAHVVRTGSLLPLSAEEALRQGHMLLLDWCLGTIPVGGGLGLVLGVIAWLYARARAERSAQGEVTPRRPAGPRPPSSESPPSAPRVQTR